MQFGKEIFKVDELMKHEKIVAFVSEIREIKEMPDVLDA